MRITCDNCHGEYRALEVNAVAHLYLKDRRCNHIESRCSHCPALEVIFLGPNRLEEVIRTGRLRVEVHAEGNSELRVRAEKAWAAADEAANLGGDSEVPAANPQTASGDAPGETIVRYQLTARHEELLRTFQETLTQIPDDLLWEGLSNENNRDHPDRWI